MADWDSAESGRTPTSIGPIEINLYDHDGTPGGLGATATARVLDADGNIMSVKRTEDIEPLLTAGQKQALSAIIGRAPGQGRGEAASVSDQDRKTWDCPESGLIAWRDMNRRHQRQKQELIEALGRDAGVPDDVRVTFTGEKFVEEPEADKNEIG